jgi:hypothetical protein
MDGFGLPEQALQVAAPDHGFDGLTGVGKFMQSNFSFIAVELTRSKQTPDK